MGQRMKMEEEILEVKENCYRSCPRMSRDSQWSVGLKAPGRAKGA